MIDPAAEALARRILVVFPPSTARTRADVDRVPVPVGRLLGAELDARADRFAALPVSDWLDRDDARLADARPAWREAVRAAARFPADVWEEAVAQAARLAVSHLVRPAETAAADAFADADGLAELPIGAALARVRVFGAYGYLPEIAARYAERKGIGEIDRPGLERLLRRIDRRMVEDFGPDEWTALTGPLYDLLGPVSSPEDSVGVGLLRALFEAKGRHEIARTLISDAYTQSALHAHLRAVMPRPDPPAADAADASATPAPPPEPDVAPEPDAPHGTELELDETDAADPELTASAGDEPAGDVSTTDAPAGDEPAAEPFEPELPHAPELERMELSETDDAHAETAPPAAHVLDAYLEDEPAEPSTPALAPEREAGASEPSAAEPSAAELGTAEPAPAEDALGGPDPDAELAADSAPDGRAETATQSSDSSDEPLAPPPSGDAPADAPASEADAPAADDEPLWKRMLQPPEARPDADRSPASTPDPDVAGAPELSDEPLVAPPELPVAEAAAAEPLWRRFAEPEPIPEPDDEDGWAVAPTLAATPAAPLPDGPLPPQTLADTFAVPDALPPSGSKTVSPEDGSPENGSLDATERAVLGPGPDDRREWFVNSLFESSVEAYESTLQALATAASWTEATQIIASEVFRKHRVNIYSEAAIAFTDAVEAQINARA